MISKLNKSHNFNKVFMYLSFKESTRLTREREGTFNRLYGLYYTAGNLIYLHKMYDVVPYYVCVVAT